MSVSDIGDIYDKEEEEGVNIDNKYFNNFLLFFSIYFEVYLCYTISIQCRGQQRITQGNAHFETCKPLNCILVYRFGIFPSNNLHSKGNIVVCILPPIRQRQSRE